MSEKVIEKLDKIEEKLVAEQAEIIAKVDEKIEATVATFDEKVAALEAKVASVQAPSIIKVAKSIKEDANRRVREQLKDFYNNSKVEKEVKIFADEAEMQAYLQEDSQLTGSGAGVGGRTFYDPVFHPLRLMNPMRGVSRTVATDGSTYQFRAKIGNAGAMWGYPINVNTSSGPNPTSENTSIWQLNLKDINTQFPIRTAALDDIDGLEANVIDDMLMEFSQQEGLSMIQNNDQVAPSASLYGGSNGLRGLNQYAGAASSYAGGQITTAAFGSSGTASTDGLSSLATYDQLIPNGSDTSGAGNGVGLVNNVQYKDIVNFIYNLPQQYWTPTARFVVNPLMLAAIRGLVDNNGRPIYIDGLARNDGIVGTLLGFDVVVNKYVSNPLLTSAPSPDAHVDVYPMYFGDWQRGHTIVDRLNMILRRYDQTQPGFITFYGEKRLASSVVDPFSIIRYRSTVHTV